MKTMVKILKTVWVVLLICVFTGNAVNMSLAAQQKKQDQATRSQIRQEFNKAKKMMHKKEWQKAVELFRKFVDKHPQSSLVDDSLYWLAYCIKGLNKNVADAGQVLESMDLALTDLEMLLEEFPTSKWVDDAKVLKVEIAEELVRKGFKQYNKYIEKAGSDSVRHENTQLKLAALDALLNTNTKKGILVGEKMALTSKNRDLREGAIFLLSQQGGDKVIPLLKKIAIQDKDRKIKEKAIFYLGQTGKIKAIKELEVIYNTLAQYDRKLKEKIIFSISQSRKEEGPRLLIAIYKKEKDLKLKKKILFWLGQSGSDVAMKFIQNILTEK